LTLATFFPLIGKRRQGRRRGRRVGGPRELPALTCALALLALVAPASFAPAERSSQLSTLTSSASIAPGSHRSSGADVARGGAYNYAPSVMLDGPYRMWWCAGIGGDHIVYAESGSLNGPFTRHRAHYQDALRPTPGSQFDGTHVCDPSVIRVGGTYYMYYGGLSEGSGHVTQIGVASSPDGVRWTKMNHDKPILTPRQRSKGGYGAGQPSAAYLDGYFYLMYTDSSGLQGGLQYAIRSPDPAFRAHVETATASGFVPRTPANTDSYVVSQSFSPDWQYSDALDAWIVLSNQSPGTTFVRFLSKDMSHLLRSDLRISSRWSEGPGLVSTPKKHSLAPAKGRCQRIGLDFMQSTPPAMPPNDIKHFGADLLTGHGCSALSSAQVDGEIENVKAENLPTTRAGGTMPLVAGGPRGLAFSR
jgi:hypothetical protein